MDKKSDPQGNGEAVETDAVDEMDSGEADELLTSDERQDNVRRLLPVHAAPNTGKNGLKVERQRGRPRKVERMPTTSDLEYHAEMSEEKTRFIDKDPVYLAALGKADSSEVLHIIKSQVAREAAALEFQRIENEKFGKDTAQISTRRIDALTKIATIELEIKKLGGDVLDLHGEKFQRIFNMLIESFQEVASEVLSPEHVNLLFNRLGTTLEGWEDRAASALAGKKSEKD
jgi:hypothetical protein